MARSVPGARPETVETKDQDQSSNTEQTTPPVVSSNDTEPPHPPPPDDPTPGEEQEIPTPPAMTVPFLRYQVVETKKILHNGVIVEVKAGKVIDNANYNVKELRALGVQLTDLGEVK